jgi:transposase
MKPLTISDTKDIIPALHDEIRRSDNSRYDHKLHAILLVAQGNSCPKVATMLGDSVRAIQYWVGRFEEQGFSGLYECERTGRPSRLSEKQLQEIDKVLRGSPEEIGIEGNIWDGKTLAAFIKKHFKLILGVRQCQRIFNYLGFRFRKPRGVIAHSNPDLQEKFKKN